VENVEPPVDEDAVVLEREERSTEAPARPAILCASSERQ
jgi:hypothetical protein